MTLPSYLTGEKHRLSYGAEFEAGYFVVPKKVTLGVSLGFERNDQYSAGNIPLGFNVSWFFPPKRKIFSFVYGGKLFSPFPSQIAGSYVGAGLGFKVFLLRQFFLFQLSYNTKWGSYTNEPYRNSTDKIKLQGYLMSIGLMF